MAKGNRTRSSSNFENEGIFEHNDNVDVIPLGTLPRPMSPFVSQIVSNMPLNMEVNGNL